MLTAYLLGIPSYYEGEDIEIKYIVFKDEQQLLNESFFKEYKKPLVVTHIALMELLKKLKKFKEEEITIFINDPALYEQLRGTSTTKNENVLKTAMKVKERLAEFGDSVTIKDISNNKIELKKWSDILEG